MTQFRRLWVATTLGLTAVSLIAGCGAPDVENGSALYQHTDVDGVYLVEDADYLAERITQTATDVSVASRSTRATSANISLQATTEAISIGGSSLQATDVAIRGNLAYITYNQRGDEYAGAVHVLPHGFGSGRVVQVELALADIDVNAAAVHGNSLLLAGAADPATRDVGSPAVLLVVRLEGNLPTTSIDLVDLPSYAATDLTIDGNTVWVTVGDEGGGLARVTLEPSLSFDLGTDFLAMDDARSVAADNSRIAVLSGTPGALMLLGASDASNASSLADLQAEATLTLEGTATQRYAKSTVELYGDVAVMALGDGGVAAAVHDGDGTPEVLFQLPQATADGLPETLTTTNAASADGDLLFRANGEAGVEVFDLGQDIDRIAAGDDVDPVSLGTLQFGTGESANSVLYHQKRLYVASGLGGMRVLDVDTQ